eukprot:TRINITY_DN27680_c0_g1_i1.p1 TRINITY_DN27680_c0_g1~~TRINITY_DN27680_c0_g1_i1.p1  ORF type:complete len:1367 (+),score=216.56 TRINITY_DN27680_c0_g1_i1:186-4286(+)
MSSGPFRVLSLTAILPWQHNRTFSAVGIPALDAACSGYNSVVVAFGSAQTGKSHTIFGDDAHPGIVPRFCSNLFSRLAASQAQTSVQLACFGIQGDSLRDLSVEGAKEKHNLAFASSQEVSSGNEASTVVGQCLERVPFGTNPHIVTIFKICQTSVLGTVSGKSITSTCRSQVTFVDLAPQDPSSKVPNKGLAGLQRVLDSLMTTGTATFDHSLLTQCLNEAGCFGGNAYATFLACLSPAHRACKDTVESMKMAQKLRRLTQSPKCNIAVSEDVTKFVQDELMQLQFKSAGDPTNMAVTRELANCEKIWKTVQERRVGRGSPELSTSASGVGSPFRMVRSSSPPPPQAATPSRQTPTRSRQTPTQPLPINASMERRTPSPAKGSPHRRTPSPPRSQDRPLFASPNLSPFVQHDDPPVSNISISSSNNTSVGGGGGGRIESIATLQIAHMQAELEESRKAQSHMEYDVRRQELETNAKQHRLELELERLKMQRPYVPGVVDGHMASLALEIDNLRNHSRFLQERQVEMCRSREQMESVKIQAIYAEMAANVTSERQAELVRELDEAKRRQVARMTALQKDLQAYEAELCTSLDTNRTAAAMLRSRDVRIAALEADLRSKEDHIECLIRNKARQMNQSWDEGPSGLLDAATHKRLREIAEGVTPTPPLDLIRPATPPSPPRSATPSGTARSSVKGGDEGSVAGGEGEPTPSESQTLFPGSPPMSSSLYWTSYSPQHGGFSMTRDGNSTVASREQDRQLWRELRDWEKAQLQREANVFEMFRKKAELDVLQNREKIVLDDEEAKTAQKVRQVERKMQRKAAKDEIQKKLTVVEESLNKNRSGDPKGLAPRQLNSPTRSAEASGVSSPPQTTSTASLLSPTFGSPKATQNSLSLSLTSPSAQNSKEAGGDGAPSAMAVEMRWQSADHKLHDNSMMNEVIRMKAQSPTHATGNSALVERIMPTSPPAVSSLRASLATSALPGSPSATKTGATGLPPTNLGPPALPPPPSIATLSRSTANTVSSARSLSPGKSGIPPSPGRQATTPPPSSRRGLPPSPGATILPSTSGRPTTPIKTVGSSATLNSGTNLSGFFNAPTTPSTGAGATGTVDLSGLANRDGVIALVGSPSPSRSPLRRGGAGLPPPPPGVPFGSPPPERPPHVQPLTLPFDGPAVAEAHNRMVLTEEIREIERIVRSHSPPVPQPPIVDPVLSANVAVAATMLSSSPRARAATPTAVGGTLPPAPSASAQQTTQTTTTTTTSSTTTGGGMGGHPTGAPPIPHLPPRPNFTQQSSPSSPPLLSGSTGRTSLGGGGLPTSSSMQGALPGFHAFATEVRAPTPRLPGGVRGGYTAPPDRMNKWNNAERVLGAPEFGL